MSVSPANMTYASLLTDVISYMERQNDGTLLEQFPRLVMLAENRITADLRILGTQQVVTSVFTANNPAVAKPAFWRRTISLNYTKTDGSRKELFLRSYEFCRQFWPSPSKTTAELRYYADYNAANLLIVGTPNAAFAFELVYIARLPPLSDANQTNWLTENAPQVLLNAVLLETEIWLRNQARAAQREATYNTSRDAIKGEDNTRLIDRGVIVGQ